MKSKLFSVLDFKYVLRMMGKKPGFTLLSIFVLGGGLGISIFTFTFSYLMSYKPLPLQDGNAIVRVCTGEMGATCRNFKAFEFAQIRQEIESLDHLGIAQGSRSYLETDDNVYRLMATYAEPSLFTLSNSAALYGRTLRPFDMEPGAEAVVVVGYEAWQLAFAGDPEILDSFVSFDGAPYRIVGIMPEGFKFPNFSHLWLPIDTTLVNPVSNDMEIVSAYGRLRSGESRASASGELASLMARLRSQYPVDPEREYRSVGEQRLDQAASAQVMSIPRAMAGGIEGLVMIAVLNLLAVLVFLLVCINVGTLLLARTNERMGDISVRVALGAPRKRLLFQVMGESIAISLAAVVVGILIAGMGMEILRLFVSSISALETPFWWDFQLDRSSVVAVILFLLFSLIVVSGIPSWRAINGDFNAVMRDGTRGSVGLKASRTSRFLVVIAIALITLLLYIGVLAGGSLFRMGQILSGFDGEDMLGVNLSLPEGSFTAPDRLQFYRELQRDLSAEPTIASSLFYIQHGQGVVATPADAGAVYAASFSEILGPPTAFKASLLEGRSLNEFDGVNRTQAVLISQSIADRLWPDQSPLQQRITVQYPGASSPEMLAKTVVGVVSNEPISGLFSESVSLVPSADAIYLPLWSGQQEAVRGLLGHNGDSNGATAAVLQSSRRLSAASEVVVRDMEEQRSSLFILVDYGMSVTVAIGSFAFLVAIAGIYGLTKNHIDLHQQEIGTRRALGATDRRISKTYAVKGSRQLIIGFALANLIAIPMVTLILAIAGSGFVDLQMFLILLITLATLFATVLIAIFYPIRQLLKLEPSDALRYS